MTSIEKFKKEFLRIYEQIAERRGLPAIIGRIMGAFFLEEKGLSQKELSNKTGYSISSVSRALDQMIQLGIVSKHKHPSKEYNIYEMSAGFLALALNGIKRWIKLAEVSRNEIKELLDEIKAQNFSMNENEEADKLKRILQNLEEEMKQFMNILSETLNQL
jgi:DNA-binding transcriptional regulator GbsR (MarR family)